MIVLYKILVTLSYPWLVFYMFLRKKNNKEDKARFNERVAKPTKLRPKGKLLWMHGASVGETISMLPLIDKYLSSYPELYIMITSGTVTSAQIMEKRLPKRAFHQYIPIDMPIYTKRFIKYWQPDAVLWCESDFWPAILSEIDKNKIPMALINGRISDKSFAGWLKWQPKLIKSVLNMFNIILGQSERDMKRLKKLGGKNVCFAGNLKFAALPLGYDKKEAEDIQTKLNNRKVFLLACTHSNEEEQFIPIFKNLKEKHPDLIMFISPRHPHRGQSIQTLLEKHNIRVSRRSENEEITEKTEVYLMDTLGEMGLAYKLCPIVFIGGSLIPHGGQNFLECLHFSDVVIAGPYMHNFRLLMKMAMKYDAVIQKNNTIEIEKVLMELLQDKSLLQIARENATNFMKTQNNIVEDIFSTLETAIKI